jgi:hypothetical protein
MWNQDAVDILSVARQNAPQEYRPAAKVNGHPVIRNGLLRSAAAVNAVIPGAAVAKEIKTTKK